MAVRPPRLVRICKWRQLLGPVEAGRWLKRRAVEGDKGLWQATTTGTGQGLRGLVVQRASCTHPICIYGLIKVNHLRPDWQAPRCLVSGE
jgi:hypothetical protein